MLASVSGFPTRCIWRENLVYFLTWPWSNRNRTSFGTGRQCFARCSTNIVFNAQCVWYSYPDNQRHVVSCPLYIRSFLSLRVCPCTIKVSPHLHNFNVHVLEHGSLGMRLIKCTSPHWKARHIVSMYDFSGSYVHLVLPGLRSKVVDVGNILLLWCSTYYCMRLVPQVRWADLEEAKEEQRKREIGFCIGTSWSKVSEEEAEHILLGGQPERKTTGE